MVIENHFNTKTLVLLCQAWFFVKLAWVTVNGGMNAKKVLSASLFYRTLNFLAFIPWNAYLLNCYFYNEYECNVHLIYKQPHPPKWSPLPNLSRNCFVLAWINGLIDMVEKNLRCFTCVFWRNQLMCDVTEM